MEAYNVYGNHSNPVYENRDVSNINNLIAIQQRNTNNLGGVVQDHLSHEHLVKQNMLDIEQVRGQMVNSGEVATKL